MVFEKEVEDGIVSWRSGGGRRLCCEVTVVGKIAGDRCIRMPPSKGARGSGWDLSLFTATFGCKNFIYFKMFSVFFFLDMKIFRIFFCPLLF